LEIIIKFNIKRGDTIIKKKRITILIPILLFSPYAFCVHTLPYTGDAVEIDTINQNVLSPLGEGDGIANRWAVLIASSASSLTDTPSIQIDTNNIMNLKNVLIRHNWEENHILVLLEDEATTDAIMNTTFEWLQTNNEDADDIIVFLFSMHGQPLKEDRPPLDEPDGTDEIIHPWDAEWGGWFQTTYIVDDALAEKFETLHSKNIIIIVHTCYSGGMIDGSSDWGQSGRIVLTACSAKELSTNLPSKMQSAFLFYLTRGLKGFADENKDTYVSVEEAFRYAEAPVQIRTLLFTILAPIVKPFIQHPQMYDGWPSEENNTEELKLIEL
jgi:hypothetical protein